MKTSIKDINKAIRSNNINFWENIYNDFFPLLTGYLERYFKNIPDDERENIAFRTLIKLKNSKKKLKFKHINQFYTWLIKTSKHGALDFIIKSNRGYIVSNSISIENEIKQIDDNCDEFIVSNPLVKKVLSFLDVRERTILSMRMNKTPFKVIAAEIGDKENAARTRFHRAKKKFKSAYLHLLKEGNRNE